jgi:Zn-dependent peptidase ImmA (M78 family)/DNA-binding XRE family transcriptional regulator
MGEAALNLDALVLARESRGFSQIDVANALGINQGTFSRVERGLSTLDPQQAERLAAFLRYPVAFFYETDRMRSGRSACLYHRKRKTLGQRFLTQLDACMLVRNVNVNRLVAHLEIDGARQFYTVDLDEFNGSPEIAAQALRRAWRVADGPILNLTALLESAGALILQSDFGNKKLFGMSCWATRANPFFYMNSEGSTEVLRWTMAHELGHLTMHAFPTGGDLEQQADAFAGEFLAPRAAVMSDLRGLTLQQAAMLKPYWRLSIKALITRAKKMGAISPAAAVRLYKQYSARHYNEYGGEPFELSSEPPTLVGEAIRVHRQDHGYTDAELAEAVLLTEDEFRDQMAPRTTAAAGLLRLVRD